MTRAERGERSDRARRGGRAGSDCLDSVDVGCVPHGKQVGDGAENGMDDAQPVDLGVALFIPYRYMEDRISGPSRMPGSTTGPWPRPECFNASPRRVRVSQTSLTRRK